MAGALRDVSDRLRRDPANEGESREDDFRILFAGSLTVYFSVDEDTRTAEVARVVLSR